MPRTHAINRRKALTVVAAIPAAIALGSTAHALADAEPIALWRRYIEACKLYGQASHAADEADTDARQERGATLVCPWTPMRKEGEWLERSAQSLRLEQTLASTATRTTRDGIGLWLVKEYQPSASHYPGFNQRDENPVRWQPYPDATTAEEAHAIATARADKEWRSFEARAGAIKRRHRVRPLEAERERRHDVTVAIAREIAEARCDGPTAMAVKMALCLSGFLGEAEDHYIDPSADPDSGFAIVDAEHAAMGSLYRALAKSGGYDPYAEWRNTPGI